MTTQGEANARALGVRLRGMSFALVLTSPLQRARRTCELAGFAATAFEAKVTWSGGQRSEKVLISKQGNRCFAKRDGEPAIYELDPKSVEEIQQAFTAIRVYQPPKADPKKK